MTHHNLKQDKRFFESIHDEDLKAINRYNDRNYQVGDTITLHEGEMENGEFVYTNRKLNAIITYMNNYGMQDGYECISIELIE